MTQVNASGLSSTRPTYIIDLGLPNGVVIQGLNVTDTTQLTGGIDALIGMDVIGMGDFSITNYQGKTCMSFRLPSLHEIDYVENLNLLIRTPKKDIISKINAASKSKDKRKQDKANRKKGRK